MAWAAAALLGSSWVTARSLAWRSEQRSLAAFRAADQRAVASAPAHEVPPPHPAPAGVDPSGLVTTPPSAAPQAPPPQPASVSIDQRGWDPARVRAYARASARAGAAPVALLRIPRLGLEVPVLEGTDEWTLDRGLGHIEGTARPGEPGNVGIAGHRDGFFRPLKDIRDGDLVELALPGSVRRYRVERLSIVRPDAVRVLRPTPTPSLTLVTCYPFYFVGPAPERFIVRAGPE